MSVKRRSATEKLLKLIGATCSDAADGAISFMSYKELHRRLWHGKHGTDKLSKAVYNLKHRGYLEIVESEGARRIKLTLKGRLKSWKPKVNTSFDGRWRLVAFDIPEKRKRKRDSLREALQELGFKQMQKSLWICPYDVSEEIEDVMEMLDLHREIDYFIADAITNEDEYLNLFEIEV